MGDVDWWRHSLIKWFVTWVLISPGSTAVDNEIREQATIGSYCRWSADCTSIPSAHCKHNKCICLPYHAKLNDTACIRGSLLGFKCQNDAQCQVRVSHSRCLDGLCSCQKNYVPLRRDVCLSGSSVGENCVTDDQCKLKNKFSYCKLAFHNGYGYCACQPGYHSYNNRSCGPSLPESPVSLGKRCYSSEQCQIRDPNSHCLDGICQCISNTSQCSHHNTGCFKESFQCRNGQCISWYFVCNGRKNCADGSDEDECIPHNCPKEAFQCGDGSCIPRSKVCNGRFDCIDHSDEKECFNTCNAKAFRCGDGACLPQYAYCNAIVSCRDGSDEQHASCVKGENCPSDQFKCSNGRCRSTAILCSGKDGCGDNSDETRCQVCFCEASHI